MHARVEQGFMLLSAVFVLLLCAVLSLTLVERTISVSERSATNMLSTQAYFYADSVLVAADDSDACDVNSSHALAKHDALTCKVRVECSESEMRSAVAVCKTRDGIPIVRKAMK